MPLIPADQRRWRELGNELLAELGRLIAALLRIQEHVESISKQREAYDQREQVPPVLRAELQIPESIERNRERDNTQKSRREWTAIGVNVLTLFAAAAYALINYHMLCEMRTANKTASDSFAQTLGQMQSQTAAQGEAAGAAARSADTARDALVSVQRAFVYFSGKIEVTEDINPRTMTIDKWEFSVPVENSGVTPTRGMIMHSEVWSFPTTMPDDFRFPDQNPVTRQLIVPGPKEGTGTSRVAVPSELIKAVQDKRAHLYIYGWSRYRDVFQTRKDRPHVTKFCYELTPVGGDPFSTVMPHDPFWVSCPHHVCSDEECDKEAVKSPPF